MKTYNKYKSIIESGKFTERQIISFRSWLRRTSSAKERNELLELFADKADFTLDLEQQDKGIAYLRKSLLKANGKPRKGYEAGEEVLEIISNYSHFTLSGLYDVSGFCQVAYLPIYTCHAKDGRSFDYVGTALNNASDLKLV